MGKGKAKIEVDETPLFTFSGDGDSIPNTDPATKPKTNRAHAEAELDALREKLQHDGPRAVRDRIRVRASVRVVSARWVEVKMSIRLDESMPWLNVLAEDHPLLMSRAVTGGGENMPDYVVRVIRRFLVGDAAIGSWDVGAWESRHGQGVNEYRTWLTVGTRYGVALRTRDDGLLNLYGL